MDPLSSNQRLDLKRLLDKAPDTQDNTEYIRQAKQAMLIERDVRKVRKIMKDITDPDEQLIKCQEQCPFLYEQQRMIFNKCLKNEIDYDILHEFIVVLLKVEEGYFDQHTASVLIGEKLANVYISSDLLHGENSDRLNPPEEKNSGAPMSWRDFKKISDPAVSNSL